MAPVRSTGRAPDDDPEPVEPGKIEAALNVISSDCSYKVWLNVAAGLYHALGEPGFQLFDRWSAKAKAPSDTPPEGSRERWRGARTMTASPSPRSSIMPTRPTLAGVIDTCLNA